MIGIRFQPDVIGELPVRGPWDMSFEGERGERGGALVMQLILASSLEERAIIRRGSLEVTVACVRGGCPLLGTLLSGDRMVFSPLLTRNHCKRSANKMFISLGQVTCVTWINGQMQSR